MAESSDQEVAISLEARFNDFMRKVTDAGNHLGEALGKGAEEANHHLEGVQEKATETAEHLKEKGEEGGEGFGKGLTVAFAAVASIFLERVRETIETASEYASNLKILEITTGDSSENLQNFEYAMRGAGLNAAEAQMQLAIMQRRIESTAQRAFDGSSAFHKLGLNAKNMVGKDAITNVETLAGKISQLKNSADASAIAMELWGRSGTKMLKLIQQGPEGIKKAMELAGPMGALIDPKAIEQLDEYDGRLKQFAQSLQAVFVSIAIPIVPALTRMLEALQRVFAYIEHLSDQTKLTVLFSSLLVSFLSFEKGLEVVGSFFAKDFVGREIIESLQAFAGILSVLVVLVGVFFGAYQTNFGGVRDAVALLAGAVSTAFDRIKTAFQVVRSAFETYVLPAFQRMSEYVRPIVTLIADDLNNAFASIDWGGIYTDISNLVKAVGDLIDAAKPAVSQILNMGVSFGKAVNPANLLITAIRDLLKGVTNLLEFLASHQYILDALIAALIFMAGTTVVGAAINGIKDLYKAFIALDIVSGITLLFQAFTEALGTDGLLAAIGKVIVGLYDLATAEAIVTLGLTAIIAVIILIITHFKEAKDAVRIWGEMILSATAGAIRAFGGLERALASFIALIPGAGALAGFLDQDAASADRFAGKLDALVAKSQKLRSERDKPKSDGKPGEIGGASFGAYGVPDKPGEGKGNLGEVANVGKPKKAPDGTSRWIKELLDQLYPLQEAIKELEAYASHLGKALKDLGTIDTPQKLAAAERIHQSELAISRGLTVEYGLEIKKTGEIIAEMQKRERASKDPKDRDALIAAIHREQDALISLGAKRDDQHSKAITIMRQELAERLAVAQGVLADDSLSDAKHIAAEKAILAIQIAQSENHGKLIAQQQKILDTEQERAKLNRELRDQNIQSSINESQNQTKLRNATVIGPDPTGDKKGSREIADAKSKLFEEQEKLAQETDKLATAQAVYNTYVNTATQNSPKGVAAHIALMQAVDAQRVSTVAVTVAQTELANKIADTSKTVLDTRNSLAGLAQQLSGPLVEAFKAIQAGANPLTASFIALFNQSRSFHDIQEAFKEITSRLAQVFDAMRPVIDLLLGVLIGLTDVFLVLFNMVASILNVFGLHIQKIKLLNSNLDSLNQTASKPLLEVTHDIPTINEFNKGTWADLKAQNSNLNNNVFEGFNKQTAKIGEVIGVLFGIKLLVGLIAGKSLAAQTGGIFGALKGLFGGKGAAPAGPGVSLPSDAGAAVSASDGASNGTTPNASGVYGYGQDTTAGSIPDNTASVQSISASDGASNGATPNASGVYGAGQDPTAGSIPDNTASTETLNKTVDVSNTVTKDNTGEISSGTAATRTLNTSMQSLTAYLPVLFSLLGSKAGGIGGDLGAIAGIFTTLKGLKSGASVGSLDTSNFVNGAMELFAGMKKGGTFGQTLGGAGEIVGTIFGGPIGGAIGNALGNIIGGFFGPHITSYKNPDIADNTRYGQDVANIEGTAGANGNSFQEDPRLAQSFGGRTGASAIEIELSKGMAQFMKDTGLSAAQYQADLKEFGASKDGTGTAVHGKNIGDIGFSGVQGQSGTARYDELDRALQEFAQGLTNAGEGLNSMFGAQDVNLASLYGNGQVVTIAGGYSVAGNGGTNTAPGTSSPLQKESALPSITISIGSIHGTDEAAVRSVLDPIMARYASNLARQQIINSRTSNAISGRETT